MTEKTQNITDLVKKVNEALKNGEPNNITVDSYSGYSGYKPQFIVDAMNIIVGIGEWGFEELSSEIVTVKSSTGESSLAISQVKVFLKGIDVMPVGWGQSRVTKGDIGDAKKGAQTDAIKKVLSYFSIGNRAYLGMLTTPSNERSTTQTGTPVKDDEVTQSMLDEEAKRRGPCPDCGSPMRVSSKGNVVCSEACWLKGQK